MKVRDILAKKGGHVVTVTEGARIGDVVDLLHARRIGAVVGEKLWMLTAGHQVLCVTHLPQLASFADRHFHASKEVRDKRTQSYVRLLDEENRRVQEIAAMLGGAGESVMQSARDILHDAAHRKADLRPDEQQPVQKKML